MSVNSLPITDTIRILNGKRNVDRIIRSNSNFFQPNERYKIVISEKYIVIHRVPELYEGKSLTGNRVKNWHSFGLVNSDIKQGEYDFHPESNSDRLIIKIK